MIENLNKYSSKHITFVTTGDIVDIATSKRAFGMADPLVSLGYRVSILLQDTPANRDRIRIEAPSAEPYWFKACSPVQEVILKRKLLRNLSPDIIYVGSFGLRNLVAPYSSDRAIYLVEHSELPSSITNSSMLRRIYNYFFEFLAIRVFDGQICASRYLEKYIQARLPRKKELRVHYSPYAYSRDILWPNRAKKVEILTAPRKRILYMGTLARNYGIFHILDALSLMRGDSDDFECVILGKGRHYAEAVSYAHHLKLSGFVRFYGYVPETDLPTHLSGADAFIAPIFNTTQDIARCPSKMFMYLPFNRPIVTSSIGEAVELFGLNYSYYFEPDNVEDLARVLRKALDTPENWSQTWRAEDHEWQIRAEALHKWLRTLQHEVIK